MARGHVLVVEDDPDVAATICELLGEREWRCCRAPNDHEAFRELDRRRSWDALVVDVNLGAGLTGYDIGRYARKLYPQLPLVFVSGEAKPRRLHAFGVHGSVFLEKPFSAEQLWDAIDVQIATRSEQRSRSLSGATG